MKILITGANGMVGRNLCENENISLHDLLTPSSTNLNLLNFNEVLLFLKSTVPDLIIHCAGKVGGIQSNMNDMYGYFSDNILMGINLVKAAKESGIKKLINLSSSCAYPKDHNKPLKEDDILQAPLEPTNEGYALAKVSVLKMCEYISKQFPEYQYKTLVPCNLYGRWDKFSENNSHMIPAVIKKIHLAKKNGDKTVSIWGDGNSRREFMYVKDLTNCIAKILSDFDSIPLIMNCGLGYDYTINEYYSEIKKIVGWNGEFEHDMSKPLGMKQKLLDTTLQTTWGWKPKYTLKQGIEETYNFFRSNYEYKI